MGLGFSLIAQKPKRRFFGIFAGETKWKVVIQDEIMSAAAERKIEFLFTRTDDPSRIAGHFCEEWLDYSEQTETIMLSSKTSSCGPGYHAFLIDVVDRLRARHQLEFQENNDHFDETGYFTARDFAELQRQHAVWLGALARHVSAQPNGGGQQMVNLPVDAVLPFGTSNDVLTPRGPISTSAFKTISEAAHDNLLEYAADWFPWWTQSVTAPDLVRTARTIMWSDVPWHVPANDWEQNLMAAPVKALQVARSIQPQVDIPLTELNEINTFLASNSAKTLRPAESGIGYRRHLCNWRIGSDWSAEFPGYWYEFSNGDQGGFTFAGQEMWVTTFTVEKKPGAEKSPIELPKLEAEEETVFEVEKDSCWYRLSKFTALEAGNRFRYFLWATRPDGVLSVSFLGDDASWEATVESIARSIRPGRSFD